MMTNSLPPHFNSPNSLDLSYAAPPARISGMAVSSMILGIVAFPGVCFFGLGFLLGLVALVLGIISLIKVNKNPGQVAGKGFAITGITLGSVIMLGLPLLVVELFAPMHGSRELANRSNCAANLTGIMKANIVYANDYADDFPITAGSGPSGTLSYAISSQTVISPATSNAKDALDSYFYSDPPANKVPRIDNDVTHVLWILAIRSSIGAKLLICKSDPTGDPTGSPLVDAANNYYANPMPGGLSYSIAYPWSTTRPGAAPYWHNNTDSSVPLISDMALEGSDMGMPAARTPAADYNSPNHNGDGQNVAYGDGHVDWNRDPKTPGQNDDNIFTGGPGNPARRGAPYVPYSGATSLVNQWSGNAAPYDIFMIPARSGTTTVAR